MLITKLKSKIHLATVTNTELDYEGSCAIDETLLRAANIQDNEQVHILNRRNGERFITYVIPSKISGEVSIRGPGAHKVQVGDIIVIIAYVQCLPDEILTPNVIFVKPDNSIAEPGYEHNPVQYYRNR